MSPCVRMLESKFECRADTVGFDLAAVGSVVRDTQGCSLAELGLKSDADRRNCRKFLAFNLGGSSVSELKFGLAARIPHVLGPIHISNGLELSCADIKRNFNAGTEMAYCEVLAIKLCS